MTRRLLLLFVLLLIFYTNSQSQINRIVDNYSKIRFGRIIRPVVGAFEFINLPAPLEPVTINFTLEIIVDIPDEQNISAADWLIEILCQDNRVKLLSDSIIYWSGPHSKGDQFSGIIECIPLSSGLHGIYVKINHNSDAGLPVKWCLDENGVLLYLSNPQVDIPKCDPLWTYYFNEDSVFVKLDSRTNSPFIHEVTIKPVPIIGDTSIVHIRLKAKKDFLEGIDLKFTGSQMEVLSYPQSINYSIIKNQVIDLYFTIVPKAVNFRHGIALEINKDIYNKGDRKNKHKLGIPFIFNNDGTLRYVNDQSFGLFKQIKYYPNVFQEPRKGDMEVIIIPKDELPVYKKY